MILTCAVCASVGEELGTLNLAFSLQLVSRADDNFMLPDIDRRRAVIRLRQIYCLKYLIGAALGACSFFPELIPLRLLMFFLMMAQPRLCLPPSFAC